MTAIFGNSTDLGGEKAVANAVAKTKTPPPFSLRLTAEERKRLEYEAGRMPLGAYVRLRLFDTEATPRLTRGRAPIKDHKTIAALLAKLGDARLANNLNQLAKAVNSGSLMVSPTTDDDIHAAYVEIHWMRERLIDALGLHEASYDP
ncbi:MAG: hypothetical protein PHW63_08040 [Alphaproteobacteria bacterium]|nr:hypothetical protein [Alphaproteobacteria bacterium]